MKTYNLIRQKKEGNEHYHSLCVYIVRIDKSFDYHSRSGQLLCDGLIYLLINQCIAILFQCLNCLSYVRVEIPHQFFFEKNHRAKLTQTKNLTIYIVTPGPRRCKRIDQKHHDPCIPPPPLPRLSLLFSQTHTNFRDS